MLTAGLALIEQETIGADLTLEDVKNETINSLALGLGDWAEELQLIGKRRNLLEKRLRELVINFIKFTALSDPNSKPAKERILNGVNDKRRVDLSHLSIHELGEGLYWLEVVNLIKREWEIFQKVFGDKTQFKDNADIVNDCPDAHAKTIDLADVALYRRALTRFEEKLARL